MGIVTEKKFLTNEELQTLKNIQAEIQAIVLEFGEIEMARIQAENRYQTTKGFLEEFMNKELNRWNGGPQPTPTNTEDDWYNNLDTYPLIED